MYAATLSLLPGLVLGLVVGVLSTLAMDAVMPRLGEGETAPYVAASVLTGRDVDEAPRRLAATVHYVAGAGSGLLFVGLVAAVELLLARVAPLAGTAEVVAAVGVAAGVQLVLMVAFFAVVPLPRASGLTPARLRTTRNHWAALATVYVVAAGLLVGAAAWP